MAIATAQYPEVSPATKTKVFPMDLASICEIGIEEWQRRFFWPISWPEFLALEDEVTDVFDEHIVRHRGHFLSDLILVAYKGYLEFSNLIHELHVLNSLRAEGLVPAIRSAQRYSHIIAYGTPAHGAPRTLESGRPGWLRKKAQRLRMMRKLGNHSSFFKPRMQNGHAGLVTDISLSDYTLHFVRNHYPGCVEFQTLEELLSDDFVIPEQEKAEISHVCGELTQHLTDVASEYDVRFTREQRGYLENTMIDRLVGTYKVIQRLQGSDRLSARHLFLGANRHDLSRALSVVTRRLGGKVTGFAHGEPVVYEWKKIAWMELSLVDEYVSYSNELAGHLTKVMHSIPPPNGNRPTILASPQPWLKKIWQGQKKQVRPREITKVMLVGNVYRESGLSCVTSFPAPVQLHLELRLIKYLQKAGYDVVYKQHPGGLLRDNVFDFRRLGVEVIRDDFEHNLNRADAFLFYHTRTTTFGAALCTKKPIVILDGGWEKIVPKLKKELAQRCQFVTCSFNDRNLLELDASCKENMSAALDKASHDTVAQHLLGVT